MASVQRCAACCTFFLQARPGTCSQHASCPPWISAPCRASPTAAGPSTHWCTTACPRFCRWASCLQGQPRIGFSSRCAGAQGLLQPNHPAICSPQTSAWATLCRLAGIRYGALHPPANVGVVHCQLQGSFWGGAGVSNVSGKTAELSPSGQTLAVRGAAQPSFVPISAHQQELELESGTVLRECDSTGAWAPCSSLYAFAPSSPDLKRKRNGSAGRLVSVYHFSGGSAQQHCFDMPREERVGQLAWSACSQQLAVCVYAQGGYHTHLTLLTPSTGSLVDVEVAHGVSPFAWAGHPAACRLLTVSAEMALQVHSFVGGAPQQVCQLPLIPVLNCPEDSVSPDDPEVFNLCATLDGSKVVCGCHGDIHGMWLHVIVVQVTKQPPVVLGHRVLREFENVSLAGLSMCVGLDMWAAASADDQSLLVLDFACQVLWTSDGAAPAFSPCGTLLAELWHTSVDVRRASTGELVHSWSPADTFALSPDSASQSSSASESETAGWQMNELNSDTLHWCPTSGHIHLTSVLRVGEDGSESAFTGRYIWFAAVLRFC